MSFGCVLMWLERWASEVCWFGFEGDLFLEGCLGFGGSGLYV